ncbi:TetR family transcriptional regulator [Amycolatopsis magusensis]|uniref:TetR family transcriptional regulator n=1 Tax=Amycolatopsis magusensis TaxID=882444 RepID=UPI0037A934FB
MRQFITAVAADLFADREHSEVSLDELAATAGMTTRHLQSYFTSIEAVRAALPPVPP